MKKHFTSIKHIRVQKTRLAKDLRRRTDRKNLKIRDRLHLRKFNLNSNVSNTRIVGETVFAPTDFRLIENVEECLSFYRDLRSENSISTRRNRRSATMSLKNVKEIDYGAISILTAIGDDLRLKGINLNGDFPFDVKCKKFIEESGFLNNLYIQNTRRRFPKAEKSELIFFEKGRGVLSNEDNIKISILVKNVVKYLTGVERYFLPVKTIILEICGNSIEWGETENKQWLLGVRYDNDKVLFTVTDVGRGILDTLYRKYKDIFIKDAFKKDHEILGRAFDKKYESSTNEVNRNKGLPSVKFNFKEGNIKYLKVLTNNVILHYDDENFSKTFDRGSARFKGTYYQWEMDKECITNLNADKDGN